MLQLLGTGKAYIVRVIATFMDGTQQTPLQLATVTLRRSDRTLSGGQSCDNLINPACSKVKFVRM